VDKKYLYVCDFSNHRLQILLKENGQFVFQWGNTGKTGTEKGEFHSPYSIFYDEFEKIFYVGDYQSVQLFIRESDDVDNFKGKCIQRLGEKMSGREMNQLYGVYGIYKFDDRLYVSDVGNARVQIFQLK